MSYYLNEPTYYLNEPTYYTLLTTRYYFHQFVIAVLIE